MHTFMHAYIYTVLTCIYSNYISTCMNTKVVYKQTCSRWNSFKSELKFMKNSSKYAKETLMKYQDYVTSICKNHQYRMYLFFLM